MEEKGNFPEGVFIDLRSLLKLEGAARRFSFLAGRQKAGSVLAGRHASRIRGRGLDFEEVRRYVRGDDIRNMDWKVTARTRKPHLRVYSEEKERPVVIVADQSKSMFFGSVKKTKAVVAAELAALIAFSVLNDGDRVGGLVFADQGIDLIFPKRDRRNIYRFFDLLVKRNRELLYSDPVDLKEALSEVASKIDQLVTHDFLVVIISDFYRYDPDVFKLISRVRQKNDVILARVSDPLEEEIPQREIILGQGEQQVGFRKDISAARKAYREAYQREWQNFRDLALQFQMPLFEFRTDLDVPSQLKKQMGKIY